MKAELCPKILCILGFTQGFRCLRKRFHLYGVHRFGKYKVLASTATGRRTVRIPPCLRRLDRAYASLRLSTAEVEILTRDEVAGVRGNNIQEAASISV